MKKYILGLLLLLGMATVVMAGSYTVNRHMYKPSPHESGYADLVNINNWDNLDAWSATVQMRVYGFCDPLNQAITAINSNGTVVCVNLPTNTALNYCNGIVPLNGQFLQWNTSGNCWVGTVPSGFGNVIGPGSSTDSQLPLFSGTGGTTLKLFSSSGLLKATSGVVSVASAGTDYASMSILSSGSTTGLLIPADWTAFNAKASSTVYSSATVTGVLKPADWTAFNNKLNVNGNGSSLTGITPVQVGAAAASSNLISLSSPGTYKLLGTNGSSLIQEIAYGAQGLILTGTGVSSAPTFTNNLTLPKSSGVAGDMCMYTANSTDLFGICLEGPTDARSSNLVLKYPNGSPSGGQLISWATPVAGVSQGSYITLAGGGNLSNQGTLTLHQMAVVYDSTHIKGVSVTASKVLCSDSNGEPVACTNLTDLAFSSYAPLVSPSFTTPNIGAATGTSLIVTGVVDGLTNVVLTTATSNAVESPEKLAIYNYNNYTTAGTAVAYTLPTAEAGKQRCYGNYTGKTGAITINTSAAGQYIDVDGINTTSGGYVTSGGALGDKMCFNGVDGTHWVAWTAKGSWLVH